ncbi:MAG: hypothetical protein IIW86_02400 [Clostridia bacterium]|nr:hypothetical protein [Clostridia bacterium]
MSLICQCPAAAALTDIPAVKCSENFGQIQKVAFQRLFDDDGDKNSFASAGTTTITDTITLKASWLSFMTADDSTKIVVSPYINAPADSGGDARMSSGGNDDLGGIPTVLGGNPVQFTGSIRAVSQAVIKIMKELQCEANAGNLGVYLFDEYGNIEAIQDQTDPKTFYPIPIRALFIGSKIHGNFDAKDSNAISWYYPDNYSDDLAIVKPAFNPLTELVLEEE